LAQIAAPAADGGAATGMTGGGAAPFKDGTGFAGGNFAGGSPFPGSLTLGSSGMPCATRHEQTKTKRAENCVTSMDQEKTDGEYKG